MLKTVNRIKDLLFNIAKMFVTNMTTIFLCMLCGFAVYLILNRVIKPESPDSTAVQIKDFVANVKPNMIPEMNSVELFSLAEIKHYGKFDSATDMESAIDLYTRSLNSTTEDRHIGKCHLSIGNLFYESKDAERAIEQYLKAIENGYEEGIIHIAKMYSFGIHPFVLPDKLFAAKIFSRYTHLTDTLSRWCKFYIQELNELSYNDIDTMSYNSVMNSKTLPTNILERIDHSVEQMKHTEIIPYNKPFDDSWMKTYDDEDPNDQRFGHRLKILERIPNQRVMNDSQNVHDHVLQSTAKEIIQQLDTQKNSNSETETNPDDFMSDKNDFIKTTGTTDDNVIMTLDSLGDAIHSRYDKSEQDVFSMIWNRVKDNADMTKIIEDNLSSAIED